MKKVIDGAVHESNDGATWHQAEPRRTSSLRAVILRKPKEQTYWIGTGPKPYGHYVVFVLGEHQIVVRDRWYTRWIR